MSSPAEALKSFLASRREQIAGAHREGTPGLQTCAALTVATDKALRVAFSSLSSGEVDQIAVFALGGYGRGELFPHSDVDIMVLCGSGGQRERAHHAAKLFLHLLWDAGLNVGHSVRTLDEAAALYGRSLDAWTAMLESRFLFGHRDLAQAFRERMAEMVRTAPPDWFIEGILADLRSRDERFGNSVKLLEPNIKKSSGGLRDLHAVLWLYRGTDPSSVSTDDPVTSATGSFLDALLARGHLDADQHARGLQAFEFLCRVRHEMHYQRASQHDTLEYVLQLAVADRLGYGGEAELRSVEVFMRDYYRHARTVHRLSGSLSHSFREIVAPASHDHSIHERFGSLIVRDGILSVDPGFPGFAYAGEMMEAFVLAAERDLEFDFRLRGAIERSAGFLDQDLCASPLLASQFRRIIRSRRVADTLRDMNDLGVLGALIPEFGRLVAFFQHNVYHYYTADEHTLIAIANAEDLSPEQGILHEVFRMLERKDLLYMAILLHDIAKPLGVADHEITGVQVARTVLDRLGLDELFPEVGFLIRHHLSMEQLAFRRNIHDPGTIAEFAKLFHRPQLLDYLYVLTYADLSAVNRNVWTQWKAAMLQDLYQRVSEVLRRKLQGQEIEAFHQARREKAAEQIVAALSAALPRDQVVRHLEGIQSDAYVAVFSEDEILSHIQTSLTGQTVAALFAQAGGHTEVTVIAHDAPFLLSKFCAVLSANDANIFDANIFTRNDGIIIDRFRVVDASTTRELRQEACEKIREDLVKVMEGRTDIDRLFQDHHRKWKRRPKPVVNPTIRTDVQFEDAPAFTIIDVYAPDSVGFLYRVTETISKLGLDIYFAKIATRVDGIVDAFYVLERSGDPITDEELRGFIRAEILETIRSMSEMELTS